MSNNSVLVRLGQQYGVDPNKLYAVLAATAFKQRDGSAPSVEQMMALSVVADQYGLNPFTREIYAFPDKNNGIVPVVGVDGWLRIINSHPNFNGMDFNYSENMVKPDGATSSCHEWVECVIYRKDISKPIIVREYLDEVYRAPFKSRDGYEVKSPWQTHPKRFLRHKTIIQAARVAFGFSGIYDSDEADRIVEQQMNDMGEAVIVQEQPKQIEHYPQADFEANFNKWAELIESGRRTGEEIVNLVSSKAPLTEEQKAAILEIAQPADE